MLEAGSMSSPTRLHVFTFFHELSVAPLEIYFYAIRSHLTSSGRKRQLCYRHSYRS